VGTADEFIGAVTAPADLLSQLCRGVSDDAVFRIEIGLLAKTAADVTDEDAHAVLRPLQHRLGQHVTGRSRRLRLHVQDQPGGFPVDLGNRRARLHAEGPGAD
jgi:hypothetical protein